MVTRQSARTFIHDVGELSNICSFFLLEAAWIKSRAERPSVSEVSGQLYVQFGCKLTSKLAKEQIEQKQRTNHKFRIPN